MKLSEIMDELKSLGKERTKKNHMSNGAKEPVFGVTISAMKPIFNKLKYSHSLANQLYETGNYDAMYLAGMIAEPNRTKYAMNNFIMSVGVSFLPLHEKAMKIAEEIGKVEVLKNKKLSQTEIASEYIQNEVEKGRLGFKRKHVRC